MTDYENEKASPVRPASSENNIIADSTAKPGKPDIDLASWAALGAGVKPSRTERRTKRGWKRSVK